MLERTMRVVALALAIPVLGGCHSIFGGKVAIRPTENILVPRDEATYAAAQIELGRKALDDGQVSAAITAFRNARLYPDQAAAASNGLAIAYSQLGRPDLAERYFQEAVAIAPADRRYQANLQLFYRLNPVEVAMSASDMPAPPAAIAPPAENRMQLVSRTGAPIAVTVSQPRQRMVRLSAEEVRVGSAQPAPPRGVVTVQRGTGTTVQYPVRVGFAPREVFVGRASPPPARPRPAVTVASAQAYPLRVGLK